VGLPNPPRNPASGIPALLGAIHGAPAQPPTPAIRVPPVPDIHVITQQAAELATPRAHLAQLEADAAGVPQHNAAAPSPIPPVLFADQGTINRARMAAVAANEGDKKLSLPDIIPGFKANSLDVHEYHI
jgi:hypothetical protein